MTDKPLTTGKAVQPYFFGYGSLVNRTTHSYGDTHRAQLSGWRRAWRHTGLRDIAFLTAVPAPGHSIDGLIAHVPNGDWDALDEREFAYDRIPVTDATTHPIPVQIDVQVYAIPAGQHGQPSPKHPILLSYLDVVVQGYFAEFGASGVQRFFDTTDGWDAPIMNDRSVPIYPRSQRLTAAETDLVDRYLARLNAKIIPQN